MTVCLREDSTVHGLWRPTFEKHRAEPRPAAVAGARHGAQVLPASDAGARAAGVAHRRSRAPETRAARARARSLTPQNKVEPEFTYAYTLCGHEYVANEDFEKAICMYRHAIKTDERHYNAWYGLGAIYYRQEKFELAEYHFRRALSINAQSSVLHCYLGMVLHANKKCEEALDLLQPMLSDPVKHALQAPLRRDKEC